MSNRFGHINIASSLNENDGAFSNTHIGDRTINNDHGHINIASAKNINKGDHSSTYIGLQNLAAPLFDNRGGSRLISIKDLLDKSDHGVTNVGQMAMDNRGGKADINIARAVEAGKYSTTNIGLLNLAAPLFNNEGGSRNIAI